MNKEQQREAEAMKQTLKNGLFNGLKASPNCDLYQEVNFGNPDFTDEKNLLPSSVWDVSGFAPKQLDDSDEAPTGWVFTLGSTWMSPPLSVMSPHLFPLEFLTKEIIIEGYNGNKPFCFIDQWQVGEDGDVWAGIEFDHGNNRLIKDLKSIAEHNIYHDIQYLPSVVVDLMRKLHFNTEGVKEFIDASESKVYEPKK